MTNSIRYGALRHIIVGAGPAGCVLANRLTADGRCRMLLEAGGKDTSGNITNAPVMMIGEMAAELVLKSKGKVEKSEVKSAGDKGMNYK